jgi:hypothetical protein
MTEADLLRIEEAIGQPLSAPLRQFYLNYPQELRTLESLIGEDDEGNLHYECAADYELSDNVENIIDMNRPGQGYYQPLDWTPNIFILGAGGCGETFWVPLNDPNGSVYRFEAGQEAEDSDLVADTIEDFADNLITTYSNN